MTTTKNIIWKFPKVPATTVVIGDSQTKHLYQHFDPNRPGMTAFITQPGACIGDVQSLLDFVPDTAKTIILHVGTNDLATVNGSTAFERYKALLDLIGQECPKVSRVYATLECWNAPCLPRAAGLYERQDTTVES